jgi:MFS family permease
MARQPPPVGTGALDAGDTRRQAIRQLGLGVVVQVCSLSCWYSVSAVAPQLAQRWDLSTSQTAWLASSVLLGFSAGAFSLAYFRVPDRMAPHVLIPLGAGIAAATTAAPALAPMSYSETVFLRVLTGVALAGVYPPGIRAVTSWTDRHRGTAVSVMVAALAVGSALPDAARALPMPGWRPVLLAAAAVAATGAVLGRRIRSAPHLQAGGGRQRPSVARLFTERRQRLITLAYIGHMWEVYGLWTWVPALLVTLRANSSTRAGLFLDPAWGTFLIVGVAGAAGCVAAGWAADRWGRIRIAITTVGVSTSCCLASPLLPLLPIATSTVLLAVWGVTVLGDSPLYSALLADASPSESVGTALAAQMSLGYALAVIPVVALPTIAGSVGWRWAFLALTPGPLLSTVTLLRLRRR